MRLDEIEKIAMQSELEQALNRKPYLDNAFEQRNPKNMSLYERYGFETMGRIQIGDSPPLHPMIRAAK